jgi:peroxiredoxin Q/BCP
MSTLLSTLFPWLARGETLKPGDVAPEFSTTAVVNDEVVPVKLSDYRGRKVVLYFYPKDNTPGCTKEACTFRDGYAQLNAWGIALLGCSVDSADAHKSFAKKYHLNFPLLLDPEKKIAKAYGADNGIPILGLDRRITYVIGEDGKILKVYPRVDPSVHANEIIQALGANQPPPAAASTPAPSTPATPPQQSSDDNIE